MKTGYNIFIFLFSMWSVYVRNLLVGTQNSPGIWAHQPFLGIKRWTVEKQNTNHARQKPHSCKYFLQNSIKNTVKLVLPFQQHGHLNNTHTHTHKKWIHRNQTWVSRKHSLWSTMLYSPILWPIMENLSHCRAEGANFTDHQPGSESYYIYRDCFYRKWITSLASF